MNPPLVNNPQPLGGISFRKWLRVFNPWLLLVLFLGGVRLLLPFELTDSFRIYNGICWGLSHGQNWARQSLVALPEYPPFPALVFLLVSPVARILPRTTPGHLAVAFSQVIVVLLLLRTAMSCSPRKYVNLLVSVGVLFLFTLENGSPGRQFLLADPFWICAVPVAVMLYYLVCWETQRGIRNLAVLLLAGALLVFCGIPMATMGLAITVSVAIFDRKVWQNLNFTPFLLIMPLAYTIFLYFLFAGIVMDSPTFPLQHLEEQLRTNFSLGTLDSKHTRTAFFVGIALLLCVTIPRIPTIVRAMVFCVAALIPAYLMRRCGGFFVGGEAVAASLAGALAAFAFACGIHIKGKSRIVSVILSLAAIPALFFLQRGARAHETFTELERPKRELITSIIDSRWRGSRILVYGIRPSVLFCLTNSEVASEQERFVGRLDLNQNVLRSQMEDEQLHLLLPPDNGHFYSRRHPFFSHLHETGAEWLFLEETWPKGEKASGADTWQLWRCIRKRPVPSIIPPET